MDVGNTTFLYLLCDHFGDLDKSEDAPLTNSPRAPKTHWRQAAQLLQNARKVFSGSSVLVEVEPFQGRELKFRVTLAMMPPLMQHVC